MVKYFKVFFKGVYEFMINQTSLNLIYQIPDYKYTTCFNELYNYVPCFRYDNLKTQKEVYEYISDIESSINYLVTERHMPEWYDIIIKKRVELDMLQQHLFELNSASDFC